MWIQFLLIASVVILGLVMMRRSGADSHLAIRRLVLLFFVVAAALSILFPEWLTWLAGLVGVGRGTDLLLYGMVLIFVIFVYSQYRRNVALQRSITLLARRSAITEALGDERAAGPNAEH